MNKLTPVLFAFIFIVCGSPDGRMNLEQKTEKLQALVNGMIDTESEDPIYNAVLLIERPRIKWKGAAGLADGKEQPMTAGHKFKIASITKTLTATLILQLTEEGVLDFNDTIDKFLDDSIVHLDSLHIYEGISYGRKITVEQLLSHTSGIKDYMEDTRFVADVIENLKTQYSPAGILGLFYRYQTNRQALFPPGKDFDYSDVKYVLLAMIIEKVSGETYQDQLQKRIFNPLGMENSYLEYYEEPRGDQSLSHAFLSTVDLVADINTSFDWGGGRINESKESQSAEESYPILFHSRYGCLLDSYTFISSTVFCCVLEKNS